MSGERHQEAESDAESKLDDGVLELAFFIQELVKRDPALGRGGPAGEGGAPVLPARP